MPTVTFSSSPPEVYSIPSSSSTAAASASADPDIEESKEPVESDAPVITGSSISPITGQFVGFSSSFDFRGVRDLVLNDRFLKDEGVEFLCEAIKDSKVLELIDLRGNSIGCTGAARLGQFIASNRSVKTLILEWNYLSEKSNGFSIFCDALKTNTTLKTVDLRNNRLGSESGISLSKALQVNRTLTSLDLRWNQLGNIGANAIQDALLTNYSILQLSVAGNRVSYELCKTIDAAVEKNRKSQSFRPLRWEEDEENEERKRMQKENVELRERLLGLEAEFTRLQSNRDDVAQKLRFSEENYALLKGKTKEEMDQLGAEYGKLGKELEEWRKRAGALELEVSGLKMEKAKWEMERSVLESERNQLKSFLETSLDSKERAIAALQQELKDTNERLSKEINQLLAENQRLRDENGLLQGEKGKWQSNQGNFARLLEKVDEITTKNSELWGRNRDLESRMQELCEREVTIKLEYERELNEIKSELRRGENEWNRVELAGVQKEFENYKVSQEKLMAEYGANQRLLESFKTQLAKEKEKAEELVAENGRRKLEAITNEAKIRELENRVEQSKAEKKAVEDAASGRVEAMMENSRNERNQRERALTAKEEEITALRAQLQAAQQKINFMENEWKSRQGAFLSSIDALKRSLGDNEPISAPPSNTANTEQPKSAAAQPIQSEKPAAQAVTSQAKASKPPMPVPIEKKTETVKSTPAEAKPTASAPEMKATASPALTKKPVLNPLPAASKPAPPASKPAPAIDDDDSIEIELEVSD